jgi:hypothetical protein
VIRAIWEYLRCMVGWHSFEEYQSVIMWTGPTLVSERCVCCGVTRTDERRGGGG